MSRLRLLLGSAGTGEPPADVLLSEEDGPDPVTAAGRHRTASPPGPARAALSDRWRRSVERWSPAGLRGARVDPGRRGAVTLVVAGLVAALAVGVLLWRDRPTPEPVAAPVLAAGPVAAGPSGPPASLMVAVTGRVRRPGVVTLPVGSRVIDAVKAAGGPSPGADLALLNLARKLADGELVVVGMPEEAPAAAGGVTGGGAPAGGGSGAGPVDLNTATLADLDTLPGVGPVLAQRILDWREKNGPFAGVDQLADVPGIGESRLSQLRDLVRV